MPKKKGKKKVKSKEIKGQLGKKKETAREKMIGQTIGYRYDVNLLPDYSRLTPFLKKYIEAMGWVGTLSRICCQNSKKSGAKLAN